jgi:DUF971 family protein
MTLHPENIQVIGNELAVRWNNGSECFLPLRELRRACPCAGCGGESDLIGGVMLPPRAEHNASSYEIRTWQMVGGYAVQPTWKDGHNTGIYSFDYLQRLASLAAAHPSSD